MNRMATIIRRTARRTAVPAAIERRAAPGDDSMENLRLFATGWAGGMIFFATFFS